MCYRGLGILLEGFVGMVEGLGRVLDDYVDYGFFVVGFAGRFV